MATRYETMTQLPQVSDAPRSSSIDGRATTIIVELSGANRLAAVAAGTT